MTSERPLGVSERPLGVSERPLGVSGRPLGVSGRALALAVERGLLSTGQVAGLRAIEAEGRPVAEPRDEEALRFVTGFADIFVTIGIVLFLGALGVIMGGGAGSTPMVAGIAASAWLLAEFFTGRRRMALPSIVLLVAFVGAVFVLTAQVGAAFLPARLAHGEGPLGQALLGIVPVDVLPLGVAALVTIGMAAMHYVRFRVPITIAAGAAALCVLAVSVVVGLVPNVDETALNAVVFACGLGVFALAMRFDVSDPERVTRRTDIAFWLHLLAAPLIVHPLIRGFLHGLDDRLTNQAAAGVLAVFVALGIVAVIIDRRAILVSGLVYAGVAAGTLVRTFGLGANGNQLPTVLLALGAFILLVSAGWQPLRRAILRRLPPALARRLPHPLVASSS